MKIWVPGWLRQLQAVTTSSELVAQCYRDAGIDVAPTCNATPADFHWLAAVQERFNAERDHGEY